MAFAATFNGPAFSQRHSGYCDQADSTAATLDCVNKHNQDVQTKLSSTFKAIIDQQDEETRALLNEAQKNWIIYRDAQCKWESGLPQTPSLERIYELSCLTEMTERRIAVLETVKTREEKEEPREFGAQPRWMNALANDYPQIFWRYGEWKSADMDCDDEDEQIMTGISVAHIQEAIKIEADGTSEEEAHHEVEIVIAVSENPEAGRPKAKLFRVPVSDDQALNPRLCRPAVRLEIRDQAQDVTGTEAQKPFCKNALQVSDRTCGDLMIFWDGEDYVLQAEADAQDEKRDDTL